MTWPVPEQVEIDGELYEVLDLGGGRRQWETAEVPTQPGDGGAPVPVPIEFYGGFGATHRHTQGDGRPTDPTHHNYAENVDVRYSNFILPAPRITYLELNTLSSFAPGFILSQTALPAPLGGGSFIETPQSIRQYGSYLYISTGTTTYTVDPDVATPTLEESRDHGSTARARSSDVFDTRLGVALGTSVDAEFATSPKMTSTATVWTTATNVKMQAFRTGTGGRFFAAQDNKVFQVLAGQDPTNSANYVPSTGEVITDSSDEVREMEEAFRALVAGTKTSLRTFDPDAGFISRAIAKNPLTANQYDGRALLFTGDMLLYGTQRGVWMIRPGEFPIPAGPELLHENGSPYIGGQPGKPAFTSDWIVWPFYFPDTGDSVLFWVRERRPGDPGTGPLMWQDVLYLPNRECRVAFFWGGSSTRKPRLFFGAGTVSNPEQLGWVDLGRGGGPDIFDSDAQPATSGAIYGAHDDLGKPGVIAEVERVELPLVENTDANNYWTVAVATSEGGTFTDLVTAQSGANAERITGTGFQRVFAPVGNVPSGPELQVKMSYVQESAATTFAAIHGTPMLYVTERPIATQSVTTLIDVQSSTQETAEDVLDRLRALADGGKVLLRHLPGDTDVYAKVTSVQETEVEVRDPSGDKSSRRVAARVSWRVVETS